MELPSINEDTQLINCFTRMLENANIQLLISKDKHKKEQWLNHVEVIEKALSEVKRELTQH